MEDRRFFIKSALLGALVTSCSAPVANVAKPRRHACLGKDKSIVADVIVYGATPAGVAAAYSAAVEGASVALIGGWRDHNIGGMMAGGLGATDFDEFAAFGSFPGAALRRLNAMSPGAAFNEGAFDPLHVPGYFGALLRIAGVPFIPSAGVAHVNTNHGIIDRIETVDGIRASARTFIDASYEGDLLPRAGISYAVGRGAASIANPSDGFLMRDYPLNPCPISPFLTEGDRSSGLLPYVSHLHQRRGEADNGVQAYNFRLVMTKRADLRMDLPATPPANYNKYEYEPHIRYIAALEESGKRHGRDWMFENTMIKAEVIGKDIFDVNNRGVFSTDMIGGNRRYPDATYPEREKIWKAHESFIRGFFYTLAWGGDVRLPRSLSREVREWGLVKDHFPNPHPNDSAGWPYQLYIREARRLTNDIIWSASDFAGADNARGRSAKLVAVTSYSEDSHGIQRIAWRRPDGTWDLVTDGGFFIKCGDIDGRSPIPYDIMIPHPDQCTNLIVPVCVAASHQAFAAIRMETTSMALGEAAGVAAALSCAYRERIPVGDVSYQKLRNILLARGAVIDERSLLEKWQRQARWKIKDFITRHI